MLDEFDKNQEGIDTGATSPQVPENLRYLLHKYSGISAILSYSKLLRRLRDEYWSALFGLGYPVTIGPLELTDARKLITSPVNGRLVFTDEARDQIAEVAARQPFLIQTLCNHLFDRAAQLDERSVARSMVEEAAQHMARDNEHFSTLWRHHLSNERQRFILSLFVTLEEQPDPINLKLIEIKLEEAGIFLRSKREVGSDLKYLRELELVIDG